MRDTFPRPSFLLSPPRQVFQLLAKQLFPVISQRERIVCRELVIINLASVPFDYACKQAELLSQEMDRISDI